MGRPNGHALTAELFAAGQDCSRGQHLNRGLLIALVAICGLLAALAVTGVWLISSSQRRSPAAKLNELEDLELTFGRESRLLAEASGSSSASGTDSAGSGSSGVFVPEGILAGFCTLALGALILQLISQYHVSVLDLN